MTAQAAISLNLSQRSSYLARRKYTFNFQTYVQAMPLQRKLSSKVCQLAISYLSSS